MASIAHLAPEEKAGLLVAGVAHAALVAALMVQVGFERDYTPPERIHVSLATEVSLQATAPDPSDNPAMATAPTLSDQLVEAEPEPVASAAPEPGSRPQPPTPRQPAPQPTRAATRPTPTPTPRATQTRTPTPAPRPTQAASAPRMNDNFLEGVSDADGNSGSPARVASPAVRNSISGAINRQLKPHWNPPSGLGVEQLVTVVSFRLNRDGSLANTPRALRTNGQNANNRAQVTRHQEQAVRAVRLAAPFNLPEDYYSVWRDIEWNFDNRLAQ